MIKWTKEMLESEGYVIENAKIESVDLSMADHGCLCLELHLHGEGWGCCYGGYVLGHGYVGADDDFFRGSTQGTESIMRIMDVVGCSRFNQMAGKYVRVATKGTGSSIIKIIGNIIEDHWFDAGSFYNAEKD